MPFKNSTGHTQDHYTEHIIETANMNHIANVIELCIALLHFTKKPPYIYIALCSMFCITLLKQKSSVKSTIFYK